MKEKDSYEAVEDWLVNNYYVKRNDVYTDIQLRFGLITARCDVLGYEFSRYDDDPPYNELTGIHLFECKLDYAANQAYGQLLFYKEIIDRYLNSKHYEAFQKDAYEGVKKFYQRTNRLPYRWKTAYTISNQLSLWLHLVLIDYAYVDQSFYKFIDGSLENFMEGNVGFLACSKVGRKWKIKKMKEADKILITRKKGVKPLYWMEPERANILWETRLNCRWFDRNGRKNQEWCSKIELYQCDACDWHASV